jgi:two-component system CheB/CheR fusion protein
VAKKKDLQDDEHKADVQGETQATPEKDSPPVRAKQQPTPPAEAQSAPDESEETIAFPIVGIGASAGGLDAFEKFFANMPPDSGMAFVLVQHLSSPHKSILNGLVQRLTRMKVYQVTDGVEVKPNCAYIIPPNKDMALLHGHLHLMEPGAPRGLRLPIDFFFRSLAQDQHERAICIVLSGTGTDGTLGLKAIKGEGGMAMVQEAMSARYDGMPRSAIATGLVDYVLPPEDMPEQLMTYVEHAFGPGAERVVAPVPEATDSLQKIFILLRAQTGHDFSYYKQNTIRRRIERRMAVNQIGKLDNYVRYLQQNPLEVETLFRELLIGVTNFFRDPEAFAVLAETVIPRLFEDRPLDHPLRIWVPGCSTGEEAYSIAMLVQEHMDALKQALKVQIFATDIDGDAIEKARAGVYPDGIVADVSPERLGRFFSQEDNAYHVKKTIRDMVVFAEQNVIEDPPFSKMDLISCRNLLIYMGPELQKRVLPLFHYSLKQGGVLFLGNSETVGEFVDLFSTLDRKWKLYQRKGVAAAHRPALDFPTPPFMDDIRATRAVEAATRGRKLSVRELAEKALLQHYTPACVIINERCEVLYIHGRTGQYLEPASGEASLNILRMAREGLRLELTTAIRRVIAHKAPVRYLDLRVKSNGERRAVNLTVRPVLEPPGMRGLIMVLFEDVLPERRAESAAAVGEQDTDKEQHIAVLERELRAKEEYLQTTIEELETSNEELKSTNEELQSSNEELQSTNEELETSKEELQSVNEELVTVNAELQKKIDELSQINNDMSNLLAGTGVGTIFVDHQLCIQRFTPAATNVINLIQADVGRPVGHIASNLVGYDHLVQDVREVLDTLVPKEAEVQTQDGLWYLMRILPYRTLENVIEGAVLTFVEVTELKQAETRLRRLATVVRDSNDAITVQDFEGRILAWNPGAERMYGWSETQALKMNVRDVVPEDRREEALDLVTRLAQHEIIEPFETQRVTKSGETLRVQLTATTLVDAAGEPYAIATTERDVGGRET